MKSNDNKHVRDVETFNAVLPKDDVRVLFSNASFEEKEEVLNKLGPLQYTFRLFLENEQQLQPLSQARLIELFEACSDPHRDAEELVAVLHALAPGNGHVGIQEVNFLADYLRQRVEDFLRSNNHNLEQLLAHDHVFGSGGDFCKTIHASTAAAIVAAPRVKICKTGTTNVTSYHGSAQAMTELGYDNYGLSIQTINDELTQFGFAFIALSALGFPYSTALKKARGILWHEAMDLLAARGTVGEMGWQDTIRTTQIPLDIFKIVSPNAQVLHPKHHSTGICHISMLPYVLSLYLHLNSQGIIVYSYDGIDELANASSDHRPGHPNNLLIQVEEDLVRLAECSPEDLELPRAHLNDIKEEEDLSATNTDFWHIISGQERGPKRDFIVANAAVLLVAAQQIPSSVGGLVDQLREAVKIVNRLIDSREVEHNFYALLRMHNHKLIRI